MSEKEEKAAPSQGQLAGETGGEDERPPEIDSQPGREGRVGGAGGGHCPAETAMTDGNKEGQPSLQTVAAVEEPSKPEVRLQ